MLNINLLLIVLIFIATTVQGQSCNSSATCTSQNVSCGSGQVYACDTDGGFCTCLCANDSFCAYYGEGGTCPFGGYCNKTSGFCNCNSTCANLPAQYSNESCSYSTCYAFGGYCNQQDKSCVCYSCDHYTNGTAYCAADGQCNYYIASCNTTSHSCDCNVCNNNTDCLAQTYTSYCTGVGGSCIPGCFENSQCNNSCYFYNNFIGVPIDFGYCNPNSSYCACRQCASGSDCDAVCGGTGLGICDSSDNYNYGCSCEQVCTNSSQCGNTYLCGSYVPDICSNNMCTIDNSYNFNGACSDTCSGFQGVCNTTTGSCQCNTNCTTYVNGSAICNNYCGSYLGTCNNVSNSCNCSACSNNYDCLTKSYPSICSNGNCNYGCFQNSQCNSMCTYNNNGVVVQTNFGNCSNSTTSYGSGSYSYNSTSSSCSCRQCANNSECDSACFGTGLGACNPNYPVLFGCTCNQCSINTDCNLCGNTTSRCLNNNCVCNACSTNTDCNLSCGRGYTPTCTASTGICSCAAMTCSNNSDCSSYYYDYGCNYNNQTIGCIGGSCACAFACDSNTDCTNNNNCPNLINTCDDGICSGCQPACNYSTLNTGTTCSSYCNSIYYNTTIHSSFCGVTGGCYCETTQYFCDSFTSDMDYTVGAFTCYETCSHSANLTSCFDSCVKNIFSSRLPKCASCLSSSFAPCVLASCSTDCSNIASLELCAFCVIANSNCVNNVNLCLNTTNECTTALDCTNLICSSNNRTACYSGACICEPNVCSADFYCSDYSCNGNGVPYCEGLTTYIDVGSCACGAPCNVSSQCSTQTCQNNGEIVLCTNGSCKCQYECAYNYFNNSLGNAICSTTYCPNNTKATCLSSGACLCANTSQMCSTIYGPPSTQQEFIFQQVLYQCTYYCIVSSFSGNNSNCLSSCVNASLIITSKCNNCIQQLSTCYTSTNYYTTSFNFKYDPCYNNYIACYINETGSTGQCKNSDLLPATTLISFPISICSSFCNYTIGNFTPSACINQCVQSQNLSIACSSCFSTITACLNNAANSASQQNCYFAFNYCAFGDKCNTTSDCPTSNTLFYSCTNNGCVASECNVNSDCNNLCPYPQYVGGLCQSNTCNCLQCTNSTSCSKFRCNNFPVSSCASNICECNYCFTNTDCNSQCSYGGSCNSSATSIYNTCNCNECQVDVDCNTCPTTKFLCIQNSCVCKDCFQNSDCTCTGGKTPKCTTDGQCSCISLNTCQTTANCIGYCSSQGTNEVARNCSNNACTCGTPSNGQCDTVMDCAALCYNTGQQAVACISSNSSNLCQCSAITDNCTNSFSCYSYCANNNQVISGCNNGLCACTNPPNAPECAGNTSECIGVCQLKNAVPISCTNEQCVCTSTYSSHSSKTSESHKPLSGAETIHVSTFAILLSSLVFICSIKRLINIL